jgi:hypothetical protein
VSKLDGYSPRTLGRSVRSVRGPSVGSPLPKVAYPYVRLSSLVRLRQGVGGSMIFSIPWKKYHCQWEFASLYQLSFRTSLPFLVYLARLIDRNGTRLHNSFVVDVATLLAKPSYTSR